MDIVFEGDREGYRLMPRRCVGHGTNIKRTTVVRRASVNVVLCKLRDNLCNDDRLKTGLGR